MPRINEVKVDGFKGRTCRYEVKPLLAITGPMGSGKSTCHHAIRYAFTGEVEDGKKDEIVAKWFRPEGGLVTLKADDGRWMWRGITVDQGREGKISRRLMTSDTKTDEKSVNLLNWKANPTVLNIGAFSSLSAELKRRYILDLCGGNVEADATSVSSEIALSYAKAIGGKAAKVSLFAKEDEWDDFSDEDIALLKYFSAPGGIKDEIDSHCSGAVDMTLTELCAKLVKSTSDSLTQARKNSNESKNGIKALEESAAEARSNASKLESAQADLKHAQSKLSDLKVEWKSHIEAADLVKSARAYYEGIQDGIHGLEQQLLELGDPIPEPEYVHIEEGNVDPLYLQREEEERVRHSELCALSNKEANIRSSISVLEGRVGAAYSSDIGQIIIAINAITADELTPNVRTLIDKLNAFSKSHIDKVAVDQKALNQQRANLAAFLRDNPDVESKCAKSAEKLRKLTEDRKRHIEQAESIRRENDERRKNYLDLVKSRNDDQRQRSELSEKLAEARGKRSQLEIEINKAEQAFRSKPRPSQEVVDFERDVVLPAEEALRIAREAAGKVIAHEDAKTELQSRLYREKAWKIAVAAVKACREKIVHEATKPISDVINQALEHGGRDERVFIELENEHGTPQFNMGLLRGSTKVGLGPLSGGESAIFLLALSIAIAKKSEGHQVIAIEGDPLDWWGLNAVMSMCVPWSRDINFILTTSRDVPRFEDQPDWSVLDLNETPL